MDRTATARTSTRSSLRPAAIGLVVVTISVIGTLVHQSAASSAPSFSKVRRVDHGGTPADDEGAVTEDDGALPRGVTVFDDEYPGIANLDPDLLDALRRAATDAADDGVEFYVNSGWRTPAYQSQLLLEAVSRYGSAEEAARWVATPDTSPHVSGNAIDVGYDARTWLAEHGATYGLCQVYGNEPWHYELRPQAIEHGCPPMYVDPTHDPRLQQERPKSH